MNSWALVVVFTFIVVIYPSFYHLLSLDICTMLSCCIEHRHHALKLGPLGSDGRRERERGNQDINEGWIEMNRKHERDMALLCIWLCDLWSMAWSRTFSSWLLLVRCDVPSSETFLLFYTLAFAKKRRLEITSSRITTGIHQWHQSA